MRSVLVTVISILLFSVVATAQSTYLKPYRNATHSYFFSVVDAESNNPVRWYVATDALGLNRAAHGSEYTFVTSGYSTVTNQLEGTAVYTVQITWGATANVGNTYYIFIEVDDDVSGCTNRMAGMIQINGGFNALAFDVTGSSTPGTQNPATVPEESCPDDVLNPIWNPGTNSHTDIGATELIFRVERIFSTANWQFQYQVKEGTSKPFELEQIRFVDQSGNTLSSSTSLTGVIAADAVNDYVLAYVKIKNQQGAILDIDFALITTANLTRDADGNLDSNPADNMADHTILPMPLISGFGGN